MRQAFLKQVRRYPWVTNVTLYGCLFAGGDFVHQWLLNRDRMDWTHTRNVAIVAFTFHGNFNFFWMRFLERTLPGNSMRMVLKKLLVDQTTAAPLATSVFYTGLSEGALILLIVILLSQNYYYHHYYYHHISRSSSINH